MRQIALALSFAALAAPAFAADLPATFDSVCASRAIKSEKLVKACAIGEMPKAIKDGSRFANVGIGAEINTLAANLQFIDRD